MEQMHGQGNGESAAAHPRHGDGQPEPADAPPLLLERRGAVALLTLNRPDRLNAVSESLYRGMVGALRELDGDPSVRAVVLTGGGRAFCVGADLRAHGEGEADRAWRRRYIASAQRANRLMQRMGKPVVAAVNGHAIGAGLELALSSDYVVVSSRAKLRLPELALGTFVGGGTVYTLAERVGLLRAKALLLVPEFVDPAAAVAMGLATEVVQPEEVLPRALAVAEGMARLAPVPVRHAKRLLNAARERPASWLLRQEARALLGCMETADWREGVQAFAEKRAARFTGE
jgi:enoyl-CoA hydratase